MGFAVLYCLNKNHDVLDCMETGPKACLQVSWFSLELIGSITCIVLATLGLCGIIGISAAACYAMIGVASIFILTDGAALAFEIREEVC